MHWAILTTFLFALSAVSGQRTAIRLGGLRGNFFRLLLATVILDSFVLLTDRASLAWPTFGWFFVSGLVGFGVGDIGLFLAYERIGSRLAILLNLCTAPLFALAAEWLWLGNAPPPSHLGAVGAILFGVFLAVKPPKERIGRAPDLRGHFGFGIVWALVAGFGQGTGAVITRKANEIERTLGLEINGVSEAAQRVLAGMLVAGIGLIIWEKLGASRLPAGLTGADRRLSTAGWLLMAALAGPVIGVSCFQQALASMSSGGLVLAIVAVTPIVLMPMAWMLEKDRPTLLAAAGALIAVTGVILLNWLGA